MTRAAIPPPAPARKKSLKRIVVLIPIYSKRLSPGGHRQIRVCMGCEPILSTTITLSPTSPIGTEPRTET